MKSRISSCKVTALKKDLTRFAPAWGLYTILLLIYLVMLDGEPYSVARSLVELMQGSAVLNLCYGLLCAQLLFGDLFGSRMCNALHALPLKRSTWFGVHTLAGILFALVPNLLVAMVGSLLLPSAPQMYGLWLVVSMGQYLFFFGLAIFCIYCVGNRFAMVVVYGILNFLSLIIFWFVDTLYMPMFYGLVSDATGFLNWCPVVKMSSAQYVQIARNALDRNAIGSITLDSGWGYLGLCALGGVAFAALGYGLYRRRNLESAGDFLAFAPLKPVFLVIYSLTVGALLHMFSTLFGGAEYVFLFVGVTLGFFTGQMLLSRRTQVFGWRNLVKWGILVGALALSLVITALDPLGISSWVPQESQVDSVRIGASYGGREGVRLTDQQSVSDIRFIHQEAIRNKSGYGNGDVTVLTTITYTLKDGRQVTRRYPISTKTEGGQVLKKYYSMASYIFGDGIQDLEQFLSRIDTMSVEGQEYEDILNDRNREKLLKAMLADCQEGNMAQDSCFHIHEDERDYAVIWVYIGMNDRDDRWSYYDLAIFEDCTNTLQCLADMGIYPEKYSDETSKW